MTERIRLEVDDAELDEVIARIDMAILKKVELVTGVPVAARVPPKISAITGVPMVTRVPPKISAVEDDIAATIEKLKAELVDVENIATVVEVNVETTVSRLNAEILAVTTRVTPEISAVEDYMTATIEKLKAELIDVENIAAVVEANVETTVSRLNAEIFAVEQQATFVSTDALMKLFAVETRTRSLRQQVRDLPNVDRATRMILLRIPGLREVLRLLYIVKMEERTLRLGEVVATAKAAEIDVAATIAKLSGELTVLSAEALAVEVTTQATINRVTAEIQAAETQAAASISSFRGPVTAGITLIMYTIMIVQDLQRKQERTEARMEAWKREMDQRLITMEEAVRAYGVLPERYRTTVII